MYCACFHEQSRILDVHSSNLGVYPSLPPPGARSGRETIQKGERAMSRIRCAAASMAACATIVAVGASAAAAKPVTLHFFSKQVYSRTSDASGKPVPPNAAPAIGDRFSFASNDYVGNHTHHATQATASDHVVCTLTSASSGLCDGTIAIGGSMIIGDDFVLAFNSNLTTVKITGGTGSYRHAHGTIVAKSVGNNTDLTIRVGS
jgi:hypothetical protein